MEEFESVFIDTSPFIYLIEKHPKYALAVDRFFENNFYKEVSFFTSVVSVSEFQVFPKRKEQLKPIEDFNLLMKGFHFTVFNITIEIAEIASSLRAKYKFLKGMDSFQVVSAIHHNCKTFLTNDGDLKNIKEINIILVDELI